MKKTLSNQTKRNIRFCTERITSKEEHSKVTAELVVLFGEEALKYISKGGLNNVH